MKFLKPRTIDLNIYIGKYDWANAELADYVVRLRDALTVNNNWAHIELDESNIVVIAEAGGDNKTFLSLIDEAYARGCWVEIETEGELGCVNLREPTGEEWEEFQKSLGAA